MRRGKANANFFKGGANDPSGDIIIAAPNRNPIVDNAAAADRKRGAGATGNEGGVSGPATQRAIEAALKRAQQSGTLSLQGKGLKTFPMDICKFNELRLIENFWEAYDLVKLDLSNNEIEAVPDEIAAQEVSKVHVAALTCRLLNRSDHREHQSEHEQVELRPQRPFLPANFEVS